MSKKLSLTFQINSAIVSCFVPSESKRSYKYDHEMKTDHKIFSFEEKDSLHEIGKNLVNYVGKEFGVKYLKDIKAEHLQKWLDHKSNTCNENTMKRYYSAILKLEKVCIHKFGLGEEKAFRWNTSDLIIPECKSTVTYNKTKPMPITDSEQLRAYLQENGKKNDTWRSVILSAYAGLRVEETSRLKAGSIHFTKSEHGEYGYIHIHKGEGAKGNRERIIPITTIEDAQILAKVCENREPDEYIVQNARNQGKPVDKGSITKALERALIHCNMTQYKGNLNHAMRKTWAQRMYDQYRMEHTKAETVSYVNTILGHGEQRSLTELSHYCTNIY